MIHLNTDVAYLLLGLVAVWAYSRWLLATEYRKYRRPRLLLDDCKRRNRS
jgi:hypothetical protein